MDDDKVQRVTNNVVAIIGFLIFIAISIGLPYLFEVAALEREHGYRGLANDIESAMFDHWTGECMSVGSPRVGLVRKAKSNCR